MPVRGRIRPSLLLVLVSGLLLLSGCSEWGDPSTSHAGGTMKVGLPALPASWDPDSASTTVASQPLRDVEAPLLQVSQRTRKPEPGLARSWSYDAANGRLTLALRPKAEFSNGHRVTAADVVFSVGRWLAGHDHGASYRRLISGATAQGTDTVVLLTTAPESAVLDALTLTSSAVLPRDFGGSSAAAFFAHPVGAGPFAVRSTSSSAIDLQRNRHFYDSAHPYLDHLDYTLLGDPTTALQQVRAGTTDLAAGVPAGDVPSSHGKVRVVDVGTGVVDVVASRVHGLVVLPSGLYHSADLWLGT